MLKTQMSRRAALALAALCAFGTLGVVGCSAPAESSSGGNAGSSDAGSTANAEISVYSREDGSGTRGAFVELFGLEEKAANGDKVDMTTQSAAITNSTSVMMTSVASDPNAIGYISLGSLNDTVKAVKIDGVEATAENVKAGSYKISRPFNIVTTDQMSDAAKDFIAFIMSAEGQAVVEENHYIPLEGAAPYQPTGTAGKVVVAGSSSVTPVMEKLAEAYKALNPEASIEVQQSDSTTGINMAAEGTCDIGMASRELKDSEKGAGVSSTAIALDGIAVIVAPESSVEDLTSEQVKGIYSGTITNWADVIG